MPSRIEPLSQVPADWVVDYFRRQQVPEALVRWKFLAPGPPSRGRERGIAWIRDDRVQGFLGLVPCRLGRGDERFDMTWTCDWSLAERANAPGVGVRMLQRALAADEPVLSVTRGSDFTASIAPRVGHHTIEDAARTFVVPLRAASLLERLPGPARALARAPLVGRAPLPAARTSARRTRVEAGVAHALDALLAAPRGPGWFPAYDTSYLDWVVGRCPVLECASILAPDDGAPRAAALLWRRRESAARWRLALFAAPDECGPDGLARAVLARAAREARRRGGSLLSLLLSRLDDDLASAVRGGLRAFEREPQPLYVLVSRSPDVDELGRLSYLDADLQYLF